MAPSLDTHTILDLVRQHSLALSLTVPFLAYLALLSRTWGRRQRGLPPGPKTVPILGNLLEFPMTFHHYKFTEWAKVYGPIFSLKILNRTIIVLTSPTACKEIIEKRNAMSCNRPASRVADLITPNNMNLGTGRYTNTVWKNMRKASNLLLCADNMKHHLPYQHAEATQLMYDLVRDPQDWYVSIQRFTVSFALGIIYGTRAPRATTQPCADFLDVHPQFLDSLEIGTMPAVELFPILDLIPTRFAGWRKNALRVRGLHEKLYGGLLNMVENRMKTKQATGNVFMEQAVTNQKEWGVDGHHELLNLGGTLLEGADATSSALQGIVLALVAFPEQQAKLREEMDRVVGKDLPPTWADLPKLKYMHAFIEECNRFRPTGPSALPHEMTRDEWVDGYFYPKGTVLFINTWGMFHDETYFERAEEFIPERFLDSPFGTRADVKDDPGRRPNMMWGGGRRVCPGIVFSKSSQELILANFIWGFEFLPALDAQGREIEPDLWNYYPGIPAAVKPFDCRIIPRSQERVDIIQRQFAKVAEHLAPYERELGEEDRRWNAEHRDHA